MKFENYDALFFGRKRVNSASQHSLWFFLHQWVIFFLETCEDGGLDHINVCGKGATGCSGTMWNLTCECNYSQGYVQAPDGMSCRPCKFLMWHKII